MPRIYTRSGDEGQTGLADGTRISKSDLRVETYGNADELNSWLGLVVAECEHEDLREMLSQIQHDLFDLGAQIAMADAEKRDKFPSVTQGHVERLERWIDTLEPESPPLRVFILPGGTSIAAKLQIARAVCRRAERRLVDLYAQDGSLSEDLLRYLNRLSDLLFVLARTVNARRGVPEPRWEARVTDPENS